MSRQVALLRAVNVDARSVPMAELRALVEGLGATDVATHLRSGNVVYTSPQSPSRMGPRLEAALREAFGFVVPVVVRAAPQMRAVVDGNPLPERAAAAPSRFHVVFLPAAPPPGSLDGIEEEDVGGGAGRIGDRAVYVSSPGGVIGSPALAALERRRLPVVSTARNWNTVLRLAAMAAEG